MEEAHLRRLQTVILTKTLSLTKLGSDSSELSVQTISIEMGVRWPLRHFFCCSDPNKYQDEKWKLQVYLYLLSSPKYDLNRSLSSEVLLRAQTGPHNQPDNEKCGPGSHRWLLTERGAHLHLAGGWR